MKKWQLEGVLCHIAPPKLILPDPGQPVCGRFVPHSCVQEESKLVSICRSIAAFCIRFL